MLTVFFMFNLLKKKVSIFFLQLMYCKIHAFSIDGVADEKPAFDSTLCQN